jgi:hypothetical protein
MQMISVAFSLVLGIASAHAFHLRPCRMWQLATLRIANGGSEEDRQCGTRHRC